MGLRAPARITIEVRELASRPDPTRRFRLSRSLGPDDVEVERDVGFPPGQPVRLRLRIPATAERLEVTGVVTADDDAAARVVRFVDLDPDVRRRLVADLEERLGL
jgi:hypothetical protein